MRYTRLDIQKKYYGKTAKLIIQFFVVLPLLALLIGNLLTRFIIIPQIERSLAGNDKSTVSAYKIEKINSLYYLQAGVFSNKENANFLVNGLKERGFAAALVQDQEKYRIVVGYSDDANELNKRKEELKAAGYNGLINEINLKLLDKDGKEELKFIKEYLTAVSGIIKAQAEYASDSSQIKDIKSDDALLMLKKKYEKVMDLNIKNDIKSNLDSFNNSFMERMTKFDSSMNSNNRECANQIISEEIIMLYNFFKDFTQQYLL